MKKGFVLFFAMLLFAGSWIVAAAEKEITPAVYTCGDYEYILLEDGTAEIVKYTGSTSVLAVLGTLDGHRVTGIGDYAFSCCDTLETVTLPEGIVQIGTSAFYGCKSLRIIALPDSLVKMKDDTFRYCEELREIRVSPDNPALAVIDGVLFEKNEKKLIYYPCSFTAEKYVVPQGVCIIGEYAFHDCVTLRNVELPEGVQRIESHAFSWCMALENITFPESVHTIENDAFYSCDCIESVVFPANVTSIGEWAFSSCDSLCNVEFGEGVVNIGDDAFTLISYDCVFLVERDSYAAMWCKENGVNYTYPDANDWLLQ